MWHPNLEARWAINETTKELVERLATQSGFELIDLGDGINKAIIGRHMILNVLLNQFAALVAKECCSIVFGQCDSDNAAQRTSDAIRAKFGVANWKGGMMNKIAFIDTFDGATNLESGTPSGGGAWTQGPAEAELRKDAERYRWLRLKYAQGYETSLAESITKESHLDEYIDAALSAQHIEK